MIKILELFRFFKVYYSLILGQTVTPLVSAVFNGVIYGFIAWLGYTVLARIGSSRHKKSEMKVSKPSEKPYKA